ncbi:NF041680 family putative transposase [Egbenema bharatensis]|uniref:NF041680 family putative transposase n=1 Tax=Egbenema bharatensis TaxID=3463334 RepID=UPI003A86C0FB
MTNFDRLRAFRHKSYMLIGNGKDALFDLMDAVLVSRSVYSFAELSVAPVFRRQWPSLYEALQDSNPPRLEWMGLYLEQMPQDERVVLAGDHTAWSRLQAQTLRERTYEHQATPMSGAKPVTLGQGYSTIAWIPEEQGSWALPLLHERITSAESPISKAIVQLRQVCEQFQVRPLSLWDAEYGCAPFLNGTADIACDKLIRLRSNRVLYGPPPVYSGTGRPRQYGEKFKLNDATTWWSSDAELQVEESRWGRLHVRMWSSMRLRRVANQTIWLIQLQRLHDSALHPAKPLWLIWVGQAPPDLETVWQQYFRRFAIDHWYRFAKQRLHWTLPQLATPEQSERWSDLMPLLTWQLWLARCHVQDSPLPWQKSSAKLSPGRTANAFASVLALIGTPAPPPKPRGKSPGWTPGQPRSRRIRYPTVKKRFTRPKKVANKTA